jgi:Flp pilus assembly protein TadB
VWTPTVRRRLRWTVGASLVAAVVALPLAPLPALLAAASARRAATRVVARSRDAVARDLPDAVDLLLLCATAGLSLPLSLGAVAPRLGGPLGAALRAAEVACAHGRLRPDALREALAPLGDRSATLAHVLGDHLRYGVALAPALERIGTDLRHERRRAAEERARRVPVRLLGPLVACILPAFALLTVVPLLAASLRGLPT